MQQSRAHPTTIAPPDPRLESLIEMYWPPRVLRGRIYMPDFDVIPDQPLRFFCYPFNFTLSAQQTFQQTVTIGHRFYWWGLTGSSDLVQLAPLGFRVRIHDARTRQPFQTSSLEFQNYLGTGQLPAMMRRPHVIPFQRPINVQVENEALITNHVQVVMIGAIFDG
jgi:hypothetical protein